MLTRSVASSQQYEGDTNEKGKRHGIGCLKYVNGDVYEGEFKNDLRHGRGLHKYHTGHVYEVSKYYFL